MLRPSAETGRDDQSECGSSLNPIVFGEKLYSRSASVAVAVFLTLLLALEMFGR